MWDIFIFSALGAMTYRMRGGGKPDIGKVADLIFWSIPFGAVAVLAANSILAGVLVFFLTYAASTLGHGSYMDLTRFKGPSHLDDEFLKPVLDRVFGPDTGADYAREATGLAVTGILPALPVAVVLAFSGLPVWALGVAAAGALKWPAYELGWQVNRRLATEIGEATFGAALGAALGLAFMYLT